MFSYYINSYSFKQVKREKNNTIFPFIMFFHKKSSYILISTFITKNTIHIIKLDMPFRTPIYYFSLLSKCVILIKLVEVVYYNDFRSQRDKLSSTFIIKRRRRQKKRNKKY